MEMQACSRLIENIERASRVALGEFQRELDTLSLAAR